MRYRIVGDDSGHNYVIPSSLSAAFYDHLEQKPDEELPDWAHRIDGGLTFDSYQIGSR